MLQHVMCCVVRKMMYVHLTDTLSLPVLFLTLYGSSIPLTFAASEKEISYKFVSESVTWNIAIQYCKYVYNGSLANPSSLAVLPAVDKSVSGVWIGNYSSFTDWTWITGCYHSSVLQGSTLNNIRLNNVVACQKICNTTFVALRGAGCHCLTEKPQDESGSRDCSLLCEGNSMDLCGSDSSASVYEKVTGKDISQIKSLLSEGQQFCGSYEPSSKEIIQRKCSNAFQSICKQYVVSDGNSYFGLRVEGDFYSWNESNAKCRITSGSLFDIKFSGDHGIILTGSLWVGLFRGYEHLTVEEKYPAVPAIISCTYYQDGKFRVLYDENCTNDDIVRPFVCKIESIKESNISTTNQTSDVSHESMAPGTIAGAIIAVLVIVGILGFIFICIIKNKKNITIYKSKSNLHKTDITNGNNGTLNEAYSVVSKDEVNQVYNVSTDNCRGEPDIYVETQDGEYDVLGQGRIKQSRFKTEQVYDQTDTNVYHHTGAFDKSNTNNGDTYDTTEQIKQNLDQSGQQSQHDDTYAYSS